MANRGKREEKTSPISEYVTRTETMASKRIKPARYETDSRGNRNKVADSVTSDVPYSYFAVVDTKIKHKTSFVEAIGELLDDAQLPLVQIVDALNFGLEQRGRRALQAGIDPNMTEKQRKTLERVRGLLEDGVADRDLAEQMLLAVQLTPEQIVVELGD